MPGFNEPYRIYRKSTAATISVTSRGLIISCAQGELKKGFDWQTKGSMLIGAPEWAKEITPLLEGVTDKATCARFDGNTQTKLLLITRVTDERYSKTYPYSLYYKSGALEIRVPLSYGDIYIMTIMFTEFIKHAYCRNIPELPKVDGPKTKKPKSYEDDDPTFSIEDVEDNEISDVNNEEDEEEEVPF